MKLSRSKNFKIIKNQDSAFPYKIWGDKENSYIAKVYKLEIAEKIVKALNLI